MRDFGLNSKVKGKLNALLATKLYIPQSRSKLVPRPNLTERLNEGITSELTLISAPAGYGKTTLLSEWINQSEIPVAWISLDKGDSDPVQFLIYLVAALQKIEPSIGNATLAILQSPQPPPIVSVITNLLNEIIAIPNDFVLVLDDYHLIENKQIHDCIEFLLEHMPQKMHLIIACRADPPLPLARLRSRNQMSEFRASHLSFTTEETTEFFNNVMTLGLSIDDLALLESRTEGWVASLQLAALSMQDREDIPTFIKAFTGDDRHIVDYLAEEVLNLQSEQIQNFLLQTSILNRLSEQLCDFVTGQAGSQKILNELERGNLFIIPLDNKRHLYRYHHLFADLLQQRLRQTHSDLVPELHSRASKWYEQNRLEEEALDHALAAQDFEHAAYLIEGLAEATWHRGEHTKLLRWFDILPNEQVYTRPRLGIFNAWLLLVNGQEEAAEMSLHAVERVLKSVADGASPDDLEQNVHLNVAELTGRAYLVRAMMAFRKGDVPVIVHFSSEALEYLPEDDFAWRGIAAIFSGDAHSLNGDANAAGKAYSEAVRVTKAAGDIYTISIANMRLAIVLRQQGKLHQSQEICRELMTLVNESGLSRSAMAGWIHGQWGQILCDWNDIEGAYRYLSTGIELCEQLNELGTLGRTYLVLVGVLFAKRDLTGAKETIQKLEKIARKSFIPPWILNPMAAWKARIWLTQGNLDAAQQWVQERLPDVAEAQPVVREFEDIVLARIYLAEDRCEDAINLLDRLIKDAEAGGRITALVEMLLIQALALKVKGDTNKALVTLEKALSLAEPGGYIRIFIDEGPPMAELLKKVLDAKITVPQAYVKKLLLAFRLNKLIETDDGLVDPPSDRETEVLGFIAAGLSNNKISEELFISVSTVKTHIKHIYSKLNVHSRTEAVAKAKELNLL